MTISRFRVNILLLVLLSLSTIIGCSSDKNPVDQKVTAQVFENNYGGVDTETGFAVAATSDGGYIVSGIVRPTGGDEDAYLVKLDRAGNLIWEKTFGGAEHDYFTSVVENSDGGYTSGGSTASSEATPGISDFYLVRTDKNGNIVWERNFGGTDAEFGSSMCAASGGGYIIAGSKAADVYVMKVDNNGTFVWDKTYGGPEPDLGRSISPVPGGGYVVAGTTNSFGTGGYDVYLLRLDADGDTLWTKTFGGSGDEDGYSVGLTNNGGFIIVGTRSESSVSDIYLVRTDLNGDFQWSKTFGGNRDDEGTSVSQTSDGGYIITGYAEPGSPSSSPPDLYLLKTNSIGIFEWEKIFGGTSDDVGESVMQTSDDGYIITGSVNIGGASGKDMYLIKTDSEGNVE